MVQTGPVADEIGGVRDHLANERTQLAWLRTGANTMVVGLAVAKFGGKGAEVTGASLAAGILLDATIIRALLVPALVSLFGRWNWWLPAWPARLLRVQPSEGS